MLEPRYNYKGMSIEVNKVVVMMRRLFRKLPDSTKAGSSDEISPDLYAQVYNTALVDLMALLDKWVCDIRYPPAPGPKTVESKKTKSPRFRKPRFVATYYWDKENK